VGMRYFGRCGYCTRVRMFGDKEQHHENEG
jgi:hypothetical protein